MGIDMTCLGRMHTFPEYPASQENTPEGQPCVCGKMQAHWKFCNSCKTWTLELVPREEHPCICGLDGYRPECKWEGHHA